VLLIIGIVIPIFLMVEAFGEDTDMYLPTTKGFPSWAIPILLLGLVIIGIAAILTSASFFAPDYVDQMTDKVIKRFLPAYKTKAERILKEKQEWELWERFASNPNKWLTAPKTSWSLPGKIIFISSGNRKLYSINPNNSKRPINLTRRFSGDIIAAAPSLDGEKIAFVANRKGESGIYVMNPNGTKITKIAQTNDGYANMGLVWRSPSVILIVRQIPPYSETIWMVEINHSQRFLAVPSMIIPTYEEYNGKWVEEGTRRGGAKFYSCTSPAVSPDGERLAYVKDEYYSFDPGIIPAVKGAGKIIVRDLQDNKEFTLGGCYSATGLGPQAWSPDGSKIVFTSDSKYCGKIKNAIGILESKRNNWWSSSKITWFKVFGNNPAWSPDGNWIAFNNDGTIYALEVASGNIRKIVGPKFSGKLGQSPLWVHAP